MARDRFLGEGVSGKDIVSDIRWISINNFEKLITGEKNGMKTSLKATLSEAGQGTIKTGLVTLAREE